MTRGDRTRGFPSSVIRTRVHRGSQRWREVPSNGLAVGAFLVRFSDPLPPAKNQHPSRRTGRQGDRPLAGPHPSWTVTPTDLDSVALVGNFDRGGERRPRTCGSIVLYQPAPRPLKRRYRASIMTTTGAPGTARESALCCFIKCRDT